VNKPSIFLAVMDTVRPDHLSCYGYTKKTTPNIDKIAQEGVLFENAFSVAPWSLPAHASMFTGMYPSQHEVLGKNLYLDEEVPTIAEIFSSQGYETLGICRNHWVSSQTGLHRGFKRFISSLNPSYLERFSTRLSLDWIIFCLETDVRSMLYNWVYQARVLQETKKWILKSQKMNKPFFIFVNYFEAHTPYDPPQPFKNKFEKIHNRETDLKKIRDVFNSRHGFPYITKECEVSKEDWEVVKSWYDGGIGCIDFFFGKLLEFIKERGLYDDTFIVITSDHGENFGEHQLANHVFCLYDTLLHVPLIMRYPEHAQEEKRIANLVSNIDVFPTLLSILKIKVKNNPKISAINLVPFKNRTYREHIFAEYSPAYTDIKDLKSLCPSIDQTLFDKYNRSMKCVRTKDFKYIITSDGKEELYDLEKNPDETRNVIDEFRKKAEELKSVLVAARA